jgi:drug/metabolite transporter (DMT)-like permease
LLLRGLIGSTGLLCVFAAVTLLPLAAATVLQYLYPTFTALLAWLLLGERPRGSPLLATALGWLGVVLVARPPVLPGGEWSSMDAADLSGPAGALPMTGVAIAVTGALCTALAYVTVRRLAATEHPLVIILYFPLVAVVFSLPLVLLQPVWPTPIEWLWLLGVGVFTQLGQIGVTRGLAALPAARATALSYTQVAFAGLWGWWLFGERLDGFTVAGAVVILAATLITLLGPPGPGASAPAETPGERGRREVGTDPLAAGSEAHQPSSTGSPGPAWTDGA